MYNLYRPLYKHLPSRSHGDSSPQLSIVSRLLLLLVLVLFLMYVA